MSASISRKKIVVGLITVLGLLLATRLHAQERVPSGAGVQPSNNCSAPGEIKARTYALPLTIAIGITWHMPWLKIEKRSANHVTTVSPVFSDISSIGKWRAGSPAFKPATYQISGKTNLDFPNDPQPDVGAKVQIASCQRGVQFNIWMIDWRKNPHDNLLSFALVFEKNMTEKDVPEKDLLEEGEVFLIR
jgi:hypothetical protein